MVLVVTMIKMQLILKKNRCQFKKQTCKLMKRKKMIKQLCQLMQSKKVSKQTCQLMRRKEIIQTERMKMKDMTMLKFKLKFQQIPIYHLQLHRTLVKQKLQLMLREKVTITKIGTMSKSQTGLKMMLKQQKRFNKFLKKKKLQVQIQLILLRSH